jgi:hypothetical protein
MELVYSLGLVLLEMLHPLGEKEKEYLPDTLQNIKFNIWLQCIDVKSIKKNFPFEAEVVLQMLASDVAYRPSTDELYNILMKNDTQSPWKSNLSLKIVSGQPLGSGAFGKVWKAKHQIDKVVYAVKQVNIGKTMEIRNGDVNKML